MSPSPTPTLDSHWSLETNFTASALKAPPWKRASAGAKPPTTQLHADTLSPWRRVCLSGHGNERVAKLIGQDCTSGQGKGASSCRRNYFESRGCLSHKVITVAEFWLAISLICKGCERWGYILSECIIVVGIHVVGVSTGGNQGRLGLGSLCLLARLVGSLLLLHLLVANTGEVASNLLDAVAGKLLGELLGKLLQEEAVLALLGVGRNDGHEDLTELLKLLLGLRVEDGQLGQVDGVGGVLGVNHDGRASDGAGTVIVDADFAKEVLGVVEVGLLLGSAQACAALGLVLLVFRLVLLGALAGSVGLVVGNALELGLFVGSGLGGELGLGFGGFALLFALYFRVFGGVPRVENLTSAGVSNEVGIWYVRRSVASTRYYNTYIVIVLFVVKLASAGSRCGDHGRRTGGVGIAVLVIWSRKSSGQSNCIDQGSYARQGRCSQARLHKGASRRQRDAVLYPGTT